MARKISWSKQSENEFQAIAEFWYIKTGSKKYSKRLFSKIQTYLLLVAEFPLMGRATQITEVRIIYIEHYSLFYEIFENELQVITIWDNQQDSKKVPFSKT